MNILCVGLKEINSGKTTLVLALIRYFQEKGLEVGGFKPRSGNNLWYHWEIVKNGLDQGMIYGKDAQIIYNALDQKLPISKINPVHRLWVPEEKEVKWNGFPSFLLDRIHIKGQQIIALNLHTKIPIDEKYFEKLFARSKIREIKTREDLSNILKLYDEANEWAYHELKKEFDNLIIESYINVALPWREISNIDYVFVVRPFQIRIFEGEKYLKAHEVLFSLPIEEEVQDVIKHLKPIQTIKIPPFSEDITQNYVARLKKYMDKLFRL